MLREFYFSAQDDPFFIGVNVFCSMVIGMVLAPLYFGFEYLDSFFGFELLGFFVFVTLVGHFLLFLIYLVYCVFRNYKAINRLDDEVYDYFDDQNRRVNYVIEQLNQILEDKNEK